MGSREKKYVHMLNSTLCACGRTICCLLENNQTETGVVVPEVLRPFMGGVDFMPFIRTMDGKPFKAPVKPSNPEAAACAAQGDKIRQMKAAKASKEEIMKAVEVPICVEINHFSAMTWPRWLRRAVRSRHRHAIEQVSRRWRGGRRGDSGRTRREI